MNIYRVETCHPATPSILLTYYTVKAESVTSAIEKTKKNISKEKGSPEIVRAAMFLEQVDF